MEDLKSVLIKLTDKVSELEVSVSDSNARLSEPVVGRRQVAPSDHPIEAELSEPQDRQGRFEFEAYTDLQSSGTSEKEQQRLS